MCVSESEAQSCVCETPVVYIDLSLKLQLPHTYAKHIIDVFIVDEGWLEDNQLAQHAHTILLKSTSL